MEKCLRCGADVEENAVKWWYVPNNPTACNSCILYTDDELKARHNDAKEDD